MPVQRMVIDRGHTASHDAIGHPNALHNEMPAMTPFPHGDGYPAYVRAAGKVPHPAYPTGGLFVGVRK